MNAKNIILGILSIVVFLAACFGIFYMTFYEYTDYYTIIDNSKVKEIEDNDFKYKYTLTCYNSKGKEKEISFNTTRELRSDAYIKIKYMITRGTISWEEVSYESLPSKVKTLLNE